MLKSLFYFAFVCGVISSVHSQNSSMDKNEVDPKVGVEPKNSVESTKIVQKIIADDESKDGVDPKVGVEPKNSVESTKNVQEIKAGKNLLIIV